MAAKGSKDNGVAAWKQKRASARTVSVEGHDSVGPRPVKTVSDAKMKEREMKERTKRLVQGLEEVKKANLEKERKVTLQ